MLPVYCYQHIKISLDFHPYLSTTLQINYTAVSFAPQWCLQAEHSFTPEKSNLLPTNCIYPKTFYDLESSFHHENFIK